MLIGIILYYDNSLPGIMLWSNRPAKQPTASSKPAKSSTMARQVSQQVPEAVADSDMGKHTGQENSGLSAPPSALLSKLQVKVATAKKTAELSADNKKEKTSRPIWGCSAKTGASILKLSPLKKSATRKRLQVGGTCATSLT